MKNCNQLSNLKLLFLLIIFSLCLVHCVKIALCDSSSTVTNLQKSYTANEMLEQSSGSTNSKSNSNNKGEANIGSPTITTQEKVVEMKKLSQIEYSGPSDVKQSKKLFNFASIDVGAKILSNNPEAKKSSRILCEDKDKYMLIPRTAEKKWVTIELSEEILMHSIALANFEYYSCSVKHFQVLGSLQYPCKAPTCYWELLGAFKAEKSRNVQTFQLKKPKLTRFIKILFLTHYGDEFFCTLSLVRVHGSTLLEDLRAEMTKEPMYDRKELVSGRVGGSNVKKESNNLSDKQKRGASATGKSTTSTENPIPSAEIDQNVDPQGDAASTFQHLLQRVHEIAVDHDDDADEFWLSENSEKDIQHIVKNITVLDTQLMDRLLNDMSNITKLELEITEMKQNMTKNNITSDVESQKKDIPSQINELKQNNINNANDVKRDQKPNENLDIEGLEEAPVVKEIIPSEDGEQEAKEQNVLVSKDEQQQGSRLASLIQFLKSHQIQTCENTKLTCPNHRKMISFSEKLDGKEESNPKDELRESQSRVENHSQSEEPEVEHPEYVEESQTFAQKVPESRAQEANILKAMLHKIRKQEVQQMIFAQHLKKINDAFKDISKVLHKNAEEHNTIANVVYTIGKQVSQLQQDYNRIHSSMKSLINRQEESHRLVDELDRTVHEFRIEQKQLMKDFKSEMIVYMCVIVTIMTIIVTACAQVNFSSSANLIAHSITNPITDQTTGQIKTSSKPLNNIPPAEIEKEKQTSVPNTPIRPGTPKERIYKFDEFKPIATSTPPATPKEDKRSKLRTNKAVSTPKQEIALGDLMVTVIDKGNAPEKDDFGNRPHVPTQQIQTPKHGISNIGKSAPEDSSTSSSKIGLLGHIVNYITTPSHMYETETDISDGEDNILNVLGSPKTEVPPMSPLLHSSSIPLNDGDDSDDGLPLIKTGSPHSSASPSPVASHARSKSLDLKGMIIDEDHSGGES